jgi:hypothetical protein
VSYDDRLSFSPHVSKIVVKASCRAKLILKCFRSRDSQLLVRAFCTFVRPLLEFFSIIWTTFSAIDINRIESVQRLFTKTLKTYGSPRIKSVLLISVWIACNEGE